MPMNIILKIFSCILNYNKNTCGFGFIVVNLLLMSSCVDNTSLLEPSNWMGFFVGFGFVQDGMILSVDWAGFGFVIKLGCVVTCH